jgi:hypothetical protein
MAGRCTAGIGAILRSLADDKRRFQGQPKMTETSSNDRVAPMAGSAPPAHLQAFEAVARRRSFALAAAELAPHRIGHQPPGGAARIAVGRAPVGTQRPRRAPECRGRAYLARVAGALGPSAQPPTTCARAWQQPVRALLAQPGQPVADAAPASFCAGHPAISLNLSASPPQRLCPGPGRSGHPLRRAALARPGGGAAVRGAHPAAGQPGLHPRAPPASASTSCWKCR